MRDRADVIRSLFSRVVEVAAPERDAWLAQECGDDESLRDEVESLLRHHDDPSGFVRSIEHYSVHFDGAASGPAVDARVDGAGSGFRLGRIIGCGATSTVHEAEQERPRRTVALKLLQCGALTDRRRRRFEFEAEILARLQHPGIARLYEAGLIEGTTGPQPYFAMELVDGRPLVEAAAAAGLDVRQRLDLFTEICAAVQYAHTRGVIHRDLKPQNILVDAAGHSRILDFGLARVTDEDLRDSVLRTVTGQPLGTIPYMSPEQAAGDSDAIDVRTDVHALGVILYELLSGRLPFPVEGRAVHEALRMVQEHEPTRLGLVDRALRGDLETIVSKALAKDPEARYRSVTELAEDIARFNRSEPISARPAGLVYRARKFVRRNRLLSVGSALIIALLLGSAVSITLAWSKAATQRDIATLEIRRHRQLVNQLILLARSASLGEAATHDDSLTDILDRIAPEIDRDSRVPPLMRADLHRLVGELYSSQYQIDRAAHHLDAAQALLHEGGASKLEEARLMSLMGRNEFTRQRTDAAIRSLEAALAMFRSMPDPEIDDLIYVLEPLGNLIQWTDEARAESLLAEAIALAESMPEPEPYLRGLCLHRLGRFHMNRGRIDTAERHFDAAFELVTNDEIPRESLVIQIVASRAGLAWIRGQYPKALDGLRRQVIRQKRVFGTDSSWGVFTASYGSVGVCLRDWGRLDDARPILEEAVMLARRQESDDGGRGLDNQRVNIGWLEHLAGDNDEAERWVRMAASGRIARRDRIPLEYAETQLLLAQIRVSSDRFDDALRRLDETESIHGAHLEPDHWLHAVTDGLRGAALAGLGRPREAEPLLESSYERLRALRGATGRFTREALQRLVEFLEASGRTELAATRRAELEDVHRTLEAWTRECHEDLETWRVPLDAPSG